MKSIRRIFPVVYGGKKPAEEGWKNAGPDAFEKYDWNKINKGMIVGYRSGVLTIDLDFKHPEAGKFWTDNEPLLRKGVIVNTGNGKHCHFKHPTCDKNKPVISAIGGIERGVDLLCDTKNREGARYVLIPDSLHPDGKHYEYDDPFGLTLENDLPSVPESLMELINNKDMWKGKRSESLNMPDTIDPALWYAENPHMYFNVDPFDDEPIPEGSRNNDLTKIAGKILYMNDGNNNYMLEDLKQDMEDINNKRCDPPVDVIELDTICESIWKTKSKKDAVKSKQITKLDGFKMGFDEEDTRPSGLAFSSGVIPCPTEKPEVKGDVNRAAVWVSHQAPFAPASKGSDHSLIYLEDRFYQRYDNVWKSVSDQSIESVAQSYYFTATRSNLGNLMNFMKNYLYLPFRDIPFWKAGFATPGYPTNPKKIIPFKNGLFDVEHFIKNRDKIGAMKPFTDNLFNTIKLPYDFDANAQCPTWLAFLRSLWGSETSERAEALQQWIGHMMIPDITMQKIALFHGVPRSGKSTIGKIIQQVIGTDNVVATNLTAMSQPHGLAGFVGKTMAVLFDAHLGNKSASDQALEVLKGISGGDPQSINPKHASTFSTTLTTRIMIICNEMPRLKDTGDALLARLIPFRFEKSFLGHENPNLEMDLRSELPGIANWAMEGIRSYITQGYLNMPTEGISDIQDLKRVLNPVSAFLDDCLDYPVTGSNDTTAIPDLHKMWLAWCDEGYITYVDTKDRFLSKLRSLIPGVRQIRKGGILNWRGVRIREDAKQRFLNTVNKDLF